MFSYFSSLLFGQSETKDVKPSSKKIKKRKRDIMSHDEMIVSHREIAKVIYSLFNQKYVLFGLKKWYKFEDHSWKPTGDDWVYKQKKKIENEAFIRFGYPVSLDTVNKDKLMKDVAYLFNRSLTDLAYKYDVNRNLIAFRNGLYDLEKKEFRDGSYKDKLTQNCQMKYTTEDACLISVENYFRDLIPKEENRVFFLQTLARALVGKSVDKMFVFPKQANVKELIEDVLPFVSGDYWIDGTPLVISKYNEERILELEKLKKKRMATYNLDYDNGSQFTRLKLHCDTDYQSTCYVLTNEFPKLENNDYGLWRRVVYFPPHMFQNIGCSFEPEWDIALITLLMRYVPDLDWDGEILHYPEDINKYMTQAKLQAEQYELQKIAEMRNVKSEFGMEDD